MCIRDSLRAMKRIGRLMVRLLSLQLKNNNLCTRGSINLLPFSAIRRKFIMEKELNKLLADLVVEYHKLQSFHWYLKGYHFFDRCV